MDTAVAIEDIDEGAWDRLVAEAGGPLVGFADCSGGSSACDCTVENCGCV